MTNKLFIAGLDYNATNAQLTESFAEFGKVLSANIITDRYTGQSKGFGFVEMATKEEAKLAMDALNGTQIAGRSIIVKEAKPQERREDFSRGNNNNYKRDNNKRNNRW